MKRDGILNLPLSQAIASMGHGDLMIVCDAGFPIPNHVPRVDLAITKDVPDLETVLSAIAHDMIAEKVGYAVEMETNNAPLRDKVHRIFGDAEFTTVPHAELLGDVASNAKVIVRTGAFDPWGNILLYSGVDVPKWFDKDGTVAPEYYAKKLERGS